MSEDDNEADDNEPRGDVLCVSPSTVSQCVTLFSIISADGQKGEGACVRLGFSSFVNAKC